MTIKKLPDSIISRIAAGEVITSPYNIIKELIENSLDAGATRLTVNIGSTLKSISIRDNGLGICKDDLKYLCLNHYTSKISNMEDLKKCGSINALGSFGFRGEALHSISLCSHLKVTSKHKNAVEASEIKDSPLKNETAFECGHMAIYNGEEIFEIKEVAFEGHGTLIEANDIFYNNEIRNEKFYKNKNELSSCLELLKCYGCIFPGIEGMIDGKTMLEPSDSDKAIVSLKDLIPSAAGSVVKEESQDGSENTAKSPGFYKNEGSISFAKLDDIIKNRINYILRNFFDLKNYNKNCIRTLQSEKYLVFLTDDTVFLKHYKFLLFINHRLVKSNSLKHKILQKYREIRKNILPFVFIELFIDFVDVNIHPSKSEVLIGDEDAIDSVVREIDNFLKNKNSQFQAGTNALCDKDLPKDETVGGNESIINSSMVFNNACSSSFMNEDMELPFNEIEGKDDLFGSLHAKKSSRMPDLNSFLTKSTAINTSGICKDSFATDECKSTSREAFSSSFNLGNSPFKVYTSPFIRSLNEMTKNDIELSKHTPLRSIKELKNEIVEFDSKFFRNMIFVGTLNAGLSDTDSMVQQEENTGTRVSSKQFIFVQHQINLIKIEKSNFLYQAFYQKILNNFGNFECKEIANPQKTSLDNNLCALLKEYFSVHIEDGFIIGVPVIFGISVEDFSDFSVVKTTEKETLRIISESIARIYTIGLTVDYKLFNKIKIEICGTRELVDCCSLMTDLKEIYKGFDRC